MPAAPDGPAPAAPGSTSSWAAWQVTAGLVDYSRMWRQDGSRSGVGVMAVKLARELGPSWQVVAQAATAVSGEAGGYATGHLGAGWLSAARPGSDWRLGAEASVGAAGGGGVRVDGGVFAQAQMQARYRLAGDWSLQVDAGLLRGLRGNWSSPMIGLGLVSSFTRLERR
jgi:hypothetical protein